MENAERLGTTALGLCVVFHYSSAVATKLIGNLVRNPLLLSNVAMAAGLIGNHIYSKVWESPERRVFWDSLKALVENETKERWIVGSSLPLHKSMENILRPETHPSQEEARNPKLVEQAMDREELANRQQEMVAQSEARAKKTQYLTGVARTNLVGLFYKFLSFEGNEIANFQISGVRMVSASVIMTMVETAMLKSGMNGPSIMKLQAYLVKPLMRQLVSMRLTPAFIKKLLTLGIEKVAYQSIKDYFLAAGGIMAGSGYGIVAFMIFDVICQILEDSMRSFMLNDKILGRDKRLDDDSPWLMRVMGNVHGPRNYISLLKEAETDFIEGHDLNYQKSFNLTQSAIEDYQKTWTFFIDGIVTKELTDKQNSYHAEMVKIRSDLNSLREYMGWLHVSQLSQIKKQGKDPYKTVFSREDKFEPDWNDEAFLQNGTNRENPAASQQWHVDPNFVGPFKDEYEKTYLKMYKSIPMKSMTYFSDTYNVLVENKCTQLTNLAQLDKYRDKKDPKRILDPTPDFDVETFIIRQTCYTEKKLRDLADEMFSENMGTAVDNVYFNNDEPWFKSVVPRDSMFYGQVRYNLSDAYKMQYSTLRDLVLKLKLSPHGYVTDRLIEAFEEGDNWSQQTCKYSQDQLAVAPKPEIPWWNIYERVQSDLKERIAKNSAANAAAEKAAYLGRYNPECFDMLANLKLPKALDLLGELNLKVRFGKDIAPYTKEQRTDIVALSLAHAISEVIRNYYFVVNGFANQKVVDVFHELDVKDVSFDPFGREKDSKKKMILDSDKDYVAVHDIRNINSLLGNFRFVPSPLVLNDTLIEELGSYTLPTSMLKKIAYGSETKYLSWANTRIDGFAKNSVQIKDLEEAKKLTAQKIPIFATYKDVKIKDKKGKVTTAQVREYFTAPFSAPEQHVELVSVGDIPTDSGLWMLGLRPGDLFLNINDLDLTNGVGVQNFMKDFLAKFDSKKNGLISLVIYRPLMYVPNFKKPSSTKNKDWSAQLNNSINLSAAPYQAVVTYTMIGDSPTPQAKPK